MRGLTNKQDAVRRALAREFITMVFRGENNKLSGIKEYADRFGVGAGTVQGALADLKAAGAVSLKALSLIHISEPTRQAEISYAVFCLKKKKKKKRKQS